MPWPTKVFKSYSAWQKAGTPVGGIFPTDEASYDPKHAESWPERYRNVRPTYYVALPTGQTWCPWKRAYNREHGYHGEGWNISGEIPARMTVTPSIAVDGYHGFLTDGVLTDG
jgi:hypothetical protein